MVSGLFNSVLTGRIVSCSFSKWPRGKKKKGIRFTKVLEGDVPVLPGASSVIRCQAGGLAPWPSVPLLLSRNGYLREQAGSRETQSSGVSLDRSATLKALDFSPSGWDRPSVPEQSFHSVCPAPAWPEECALPASPQCSRWDLKPLRFKYIALGGFDSLANVIITLYKRVYVTALKRKTGRGHEKTRLFVVLLYL